MALLLFIHHLKIVHCMSKQHLTTVTPQSGKVISVVGDTYRIVAGGKQTGNKYALIDMMIPKGGGPGPHAHKDVQEAFYIIDGELEVTSDDGIYIATAGSFVNIPTGGLVHMFTNKQEKPAYICYVWLRLPVWKKCLKKWASQLHSVSFYPSRK